VVLRNLSVHVTFIYSLYRTQRPEGNLRINPKRRAMLTPATPPQPVPVYSGFDYVTVDAQHRRVYAAHGGSRALLVVDADTGKVVGQIRVGPMHGVAVDPATGNVFTGNGTSNTVSESDPTTLKVLRSVDVPGSIDAITYDPANGHIYADEDDGTHMYVVDAKTFTLIKTIVLPGHKPEYLAVNPKTHEVYQNIDDLSEIAVINPTTLDIERTISTPELKHNHPLQFDAGYNEIVAGGTNGVMSAYRPDGTKLGSTTVPKFDQCDLDETQHIIACAGDGGITRIQLTRNGAPHVIDTTPVDSGIHTDAIDPKTHAVFGVWSKRDGSGDFVERFTPSP
jgi:DNA-binding beta-propeller fold protein YncE